MENDLLLHAVNQQLSKKNSVDIVHSAKVKDILLPAKQDQVAKIRLQDGQEFSAKLLVS